MRINENRQLLLEIGKNIRINRIKYNMTQEELGKEVGCLGVTVCYWEKGDRSPSYLVGKKLEKIFKTELISLDPVTENKLLHF